MRLGDVVVQEGGVKRSDVEAAAIEARHSGQRLGEVLRARGLLSEQQLFGLLGKRHELRFVPADEVFAMFDLAVARMLPRRFLDKASVQPVCIADGVAVIATSDPNVSSSTIASALGVKDARMLLVTPTDLTRLHAAVELGHVGSKKLDGEREPEKKDLLVASPMTAELVATFDALLLDAIGERASDVHLEIYDQKVRVRIRVDGDLHDAPRYQLTHGQLAGLINVIKVRAGLDIAERRLPQGGRYSTRAGGHVFDLRVQTQPAMWGEHAVVRLLPQDQNLLSIEQLGFEARIASTYRRMLEVPSGLLLVVGPTGSGKSTTLYAGLSVLSRDSTRKVITIEDPIEYAIEGVQQTAARSDIGFAFADAMRAFVREDPDVILVGEIRDAETALEALRASQTGHLVLSTLHCNDAPDAVQRLRDLGMHPNSIASELLVVFAQRLAKRICDACRVETTPDPAIAAEVFPDGLPAGFRCWKGAGCEQCRGRGSFGRIAVLEHMLATRSLRRGISQDLPLQDLREIAEDSGLTSMRDAALQHVVEGRIAMLELPQLMPPERLAPPRRHARREMNA